MSYVVGLGLAVADDLKEIPPVMWDAFLHVCDVSGAERPLISSSPDEEEVAKRRSILSRLPDKTSDENILYVQDI